MTSIETVDIGSLSSDPANVRRHPTEAEGAPQLRLEYRDPDELDGNPLNWRQHPARQLESLETAMAEVGWAGALLYNERTGRLIDGHARRELFKGRGKVPVLIGSWDEAAERKILATLDPLGDLAVANGEGLAKLLQSVEIRSEGIREMLEGLAASQQAFGDTPSDTDPDATSDSSEQSEKLKEFVRLRKQSVARGNDKAEVNFWVCLVFQSWEQKQEFLSKLDCPVLYGMYADGEAFASKVGLPVTPNQQKPHESPLDKKLAALVSMQAE